MYCTSLSDRHAAADTGLVGLVGAVGPQWKKVRAVGTGAEGDRTCRTKAVGQVNSGRVQNHAAAGAGSWKSSGAEHYARCAPLDGRCVAIPGRSSYT